MELARLIEAYSSLVRRSWEPELQANLLTISEMQKWLAELQPGWDEKDLVPEELRMFGGKVIMDNAIADGVVLLVDKLSGESRRVQVYETKK